ncbi:flavodoxin domain-containing protein [Papillibacter cinnamivorans]|uniref:Flavodoxin domain-containing protein n=1 Tax=Papillibacter cinnamivorans DSM 12816 TaxID=1122930 RepID=A0A1W2C0E8_9FIRM|nr:flavodoxin domain-containing protein [Papillibacter cinnamivorans]SMC78663.1 Flavodoxin domain-containing protein [Papillibacter cinnamivorans DSM 12816]
MKKLILCPRSSGNTYQVCSYVSAHSDSELQVVNEAAAPDLSSYDTIILASGVYGGHVHKNLLRFIEHIPAGGLRPGAKVSVLLTWIGRGSSDRAAFDEIRQALKEKGIPVDESYMKCFGKGFGVIRSSHPDEADCRNVLSWVNGL